MLDPAAVPLARAILEAGPKGVDEVNQEIRGLEVNLTSLGHAYERGQLKITEYANESERLRGQIGRLQAALATAEAANASPRANAPAPGAGADPTAIPLDFLARVAADREAGRLAHTLESSVGKTILEAAESGETAPCSGVARALTKAGVSTHEIDDFTTRVTAKLSAWVHDNLNDRALKMGDSEAKANGLEEAAGPNSEPRSKSSAMSMVHSEVVSGKQYLDRLLVAGLSSSQPGERDMIPARQLDELKTTNKKLDGLTRAVMDQNKPSDVARFARGRT